MLTAAYPRQRIQTLAFPSLKAQQTFPTRPLDRTDVFASPPSSWRFEPPRLLEPASCGVQDECEPGPSDSVSSATASRPRPLRFPLHNPPPESGPELREEPSPDTSIETPSASSSDHTASSLGGQSKGKRPRRRKQKNKKAVPAMPKFETAPPPLAASVGAERLRMLFQPLSSSVPPAEKDTSPPNLESPPSRPSTPTPTRPHTPLLCTPPRSSSLPAHYRPQRQLGPRLAPLTPMTPPRQVTPSRLSRKEGQVTRLRPKARLRDAATAGFEARSEAACGHGDHDITYMSANNHLFTSQRSTVSPSNTTTTNTTHISPSSHRTSASSTESSHNVFSFTGIRSDQATLSAGVPVSNVSVQHYLPVEEEEPPISLRPAYSSKHHRVSFFRSSKKEGSSVRSAPAPSPHSPAQPESKSPSKLKASLSKAKTLFSSSTCPQTPGPHSSRPSTPAARYSGSKSSLRTILHLRTPKEEQTEGWCTECCDRCSRHSINTQDPFANLTNPTSFRAALPHGLPFPGLPSTSGAEHARPSLLESAPWGAQQHVINSDHGTRVAITRAQFGSVRPRARSNASTRSYPPFPAHSHSLSSTTDTRRRAVSLDTARQPQSPATLCFRGFRAATIPEQSEAEAASAESANAECSLTFPPLSPLPPPPTVPAARTAAPSAHSASSGASGSAYTSCASHLASAPQPGPKSSNHRASQHSRYSQLSAASQCSQGSAYSACSQYSYPGSLPEEELEISRWSDDDD